MKVHGNLRTLAALVPLVLAGLTATPSARAAFLINNGGFEAGFASWTRVEQVGSDGTFNLQTGSTTPVTGDPVPPPPAGTTAAMTDAGGPGSHVLYQDFIVPTNTTFATLQFSLYVGNLAANPNTPNVPLFATPSPASLDFSTPAQNQQFRVDILKAGTDPFSVAAADVLQTIFQTLPGNNFVNAYASLGFNISTLLAAQAGQNLRLRFVEVDNVGPIHVGLDNVQINAVPEPSSFVMTGLGVAAGLFGYSRRRKALRVVNVERD